MKSIRKSASRLIIRRELDPRKYKSMFYGSEYQDLLSRLSKKKLKREASMKATTSHTDILVMELLGIEESDYRMLYFETGSEWQLCNAKGWNMWGDNAWETWWYGEWDLASERFINSLRIDETLSHYFLLEDGRKITDQTVLREAYNKFMRLELLSSPANQAVMELSMHYAIKKLNQFKQ